MNIKNQGIPIKLVNTNEALADLGQVLQQKTIFGFDTEFDRFCREYGFKLFLLQIFDGENCYLVDPIALPDLANLWPAFENKNICKVAYCSSEDVQLLQLNGCRIKNIYDLQVAAKLCNHSSNSFSDLVGERFGIVLDKSMQKSNWRTRPLSDAQQIYASHDVIWLLKLHEFFHEKALQTGVAKMIAEENKCCENVHITTYVVKLSAKQIASFSPYHQKILLKLFNIRNGIAMQYNLPPFYIVADNWLEEIVENKQAFFDHPFKKGFCSRLLVDEANKKLFVDCINSIDESIKNIPVKKMYALNTVKNNFRASSKEHVENNCKKISEALLKEYGQSASEYILRGFKKSLMQMPFAEIKLKSYQEEIIKKTCHNLNIEL